MTVLINLLGNTDNRLILYPLIKIAETRGDVAVLTTNSALRRLLEDPTQDSGYYGNVFIAISNLAPEDLWEELDIDPIEFDTIIYDYGISLPPEDNEKFIYIKDFGVDDSEQELLDELKENGVTVPTVKLSYDGKREKGIANIRVTPKDLICIQKSEYMREIQNFGNSTLVKFLYTEFGSTYSMNETSIKTILKDVRGTVK